MLSRFLGQVATIPISGGEVHGLLTKVGADYLVIDDEAIGTVVLATEHVKSLIAGPTEYKRTGTQMDPVFRKKFAPLSRCTSFLSVVRELNQTMVHLEGGGLRSKIVLLMKVKADYVILGSVPGGLVYLPVRHIHAVVPLQADIEPSFATTTQAALESSDDGEYFKDFLMRQVGQMIHLGRDTPEQVHGKLVSVDDDGIVILTSPATHVWIPLHHIKGVSPIGGDSVVIPESCSSEVSSEIRLSV